MHLLLRVGFRPTCTSLGTLWTHVDITTCPAQDHVITLDIHLRKLIDPQSDVIG